MARTELDWAARTADGIERAVAGVRSKTIVPVERLARLVVFGLVAGVLGLVALVLLVVLAVRLLDIALPGEVWSADATAGGIFTLAGLLLWRKRRRPAAV